MWRCRAPGGGEGLPAAVDWQGGKNWTPGITSRQGKSAGLAGWKIPDGGFPAARVSLPGWQGGKYRTADSQSPAEPAGMAGRKYRTARIINCQGRSGEGMPVG
jgi:hypothetical protein